MTQIQGSYASGKYQGNFIFFKVRELSVNFMLCQGKMNVCKNVREMSGNFTISNLNQMMRNRKKATVNVLKVRTLKNNYFFQCS